MNQIALLLQQYTELLLKGKPRMRRKLITDKAETYIRSFFITASYYQEAGGYTGFYAAMQLLYEEGLLVSMPSATGNGRQPELRTSYWLVPQHTEAAWDSLLMLTMSDHLQLHKYREQPILQTLEEWQRIEGLYRFLQEKDKRQWVTREERSLELFGQEKWLSQEQGLAFVRRLGLSLSDLKAKVYGEPFVYWPRPGVALSEAKQLLIVENLSIFHTCKRVLEQHKDLLGLLPDAIIYGEGKKIEASLPFYQEIFTQPLIVLWYAGDIDPEGWSIYVRLREKYPGFSLRLAFTFYERMVQMTNQMDQTNQTYQTIAGQYVNEAHFQLILEELNSLSNEAIRMIQQCWVTRTRIPQEVLTIETLHPNKGV